MIIENFSMYRLSKYNKDTNEIEHYHKAKIKLTDGRETEINTVLSNNTINQILSILKDEFKDATNNFFEEMTNI